MSELKRLAKIDDNLVHIEIPITTDEIQERTVNYLLLIFLSPAVPFFLEIFDKRTRMT
jgi:hypothetical protein